jgi:hypothetical protein
MSNFNQIPGARQIICIILLGAFGVMGTITYLTWDIKMNAYRQEKWAIVDKDIKSASGVRVVDTLRVTVHPHSMVLPAVAILPKPAVTINYAKLYFTYNVPFLIWMALISITVGCALALMPVVLHTIKNIYRLFNQKPKNLFRAVGIALLIGWFIYLTNNNHYVLMLFHFMGYSKILLRHPNALNVLILIGMITGLAAICGQLLINNAITQLPHDITTLDAANRKKAAKEFAFLKAQLKFFLTVDAILIVLSIITTDTLRRSIIREVLVSGTNQEGLFPVEFAYMYGLVFTLYLALLYLPIYYRLRSKGMGMVEGIADTDEGNKLKAGFSITESPLESFKVALSILAPVATALIPGIIKL